jgi:hypothetical protein
MSLLGKSNQSNYFIRQDTMIEIHALLILYHNE